MVLHDVNGEIIQHGSAPYDPAKARAYYLRTRKLKGRKPAASQPKASKRPDQVRYRAALTAFLKKLPMAVEGADLKSVEAFVDKMRTKSDAELRAEATKIKRESGNNDGARVATIEALLKNRERVRKAKTKKTDPKMTAKMNTALKGKVGEKLAIKNTAKSG